MKVLSFICLTLLFQISLMKKSNSQGLIQFTGLGTNKGCYTQLEKYTFTIDADSIYIEEGSTFTLDLAEPDYVQSLCKIYNDHIECSIDISNYPLEAATIKLPEDISAIVPYEYEGWENVNKVVESYENCMTSSYLGTFTPNEKYSCVARQLRELTVEGVFEKFLQSEIKSEYALQTLYVQDELHKYYTNQYADSTLKIKDKIDNTRYNAEIVFKLQAQYEARFFPTIASNLENEDVYIKNSKQYKVTEDECPVQYGNMLNLKIILFALLFFLL